MQSKFADSGVQGPKFEKIDLEILTSIPANPSYREVLKTREACPRSASEKPLKKPIFWKLPVHPGGEISTVFDEESDFQVEIEQIRH